jgi:cobalt-precorrin-7 (C5)-methyltransferase
MHKIVIISAGPGGGDHITDLARAKAKECDVLIGSGEQLAAAGRSERQTVYDEWGVDNVINLLDRHEGQRVGVLVTGDAGIFSLSGRIMNRFGRDSVIEVIPGVSSLQAAFAKRYCNATRPPYFAIRTILPGPFFMNWKEPGFFQNEERCMFVRN